MAVAIHRREFCRGVIMWVIVTMIVRVIMSMVMIVLVVVLVGCEWSGSSGRVRKGACCQVKTL